MRKMRGREKSRQRVYENLTAIRKGDFVTMDCDDEIYEVTSEAYVLDGIWYVNLFDVGRCEIAKLEKVAA